jgi:3'-5' exoribonuclease
LEKQTFIKDLENKAEIDDLFMVKYLAVNQGRDGRSYLNIILSDKSGDLEARKWTDAEQTAQDLSRGAIARVQGKVNVFQGRKQLIISSIIVLSASERPTSLDAFMAKSQNSGDQMLKELEELVQSLKDVYIRDLLLAVLNDPEIRERLLTWWAGKTIHHAYQSGLLEHILSCAKLSLQLAPHYGVNESYVVAGAVLHDLCKIYELTDGPVVDYTEEGKLVGHLVGGIELLDHFCGRIKGFPYGIKMHLKHILISHHGSHEYGSPKLPQTSEAYLVHLIDLMDSKMNSMSEVKRIDSTPGRWTGFVKHLDRIIYKDELPTFEHYIEAGAVAEKVEIKAEKSEIKKNNSGSKPNSRSQGPLTQSLADKLKDFNLKGES